MENVVWLEYKRDWNNIREWNLFSFEDIIKYKQSGGEELSFGWDKEGELDNFRLTTV